MAKLATVVLHTCSHGDNTKLGCRPPFSLYSMMFSGGNFGVRLCYDSPTNRYEHFLCASPAIVMHAVAYEGALDCLDLH